MAKNTHAQEISTGTPDSYTEEELQDPQPVIVTRPMLGEVDRAAITAPYEPVPSDQDDTKKEAEKSPAMEDGGDSIPSSQSESSAGSKPNQSPPQPAPMTENLSSPTPTETSDVDSTDGDGQRTEPPRSAKGRQTPAKKAAPKKQTGARATVMRGAEDDDDEFSFSD
jgi:hypothetical protein